MSRKVPTDSEIEKIVDALRKEPDIAAAITGAALVDAALESLLKSKFVYRDSNLVGQLFLNRGPLSDFHSKILIAQAFGIITGPMAAELHSIKAIRNAFAHTKSPITFDHPTIEREINAFLMGSTIRDKGAEHEAINKIGPKSWFILEIQILLILIQEIEKSPHLADKALELATNGERD